MKFTKEDALKEIKGKIPSNGQTVNLSDRTINEMLDNLMPLIANDDTELSDFVSKVLPSFKVADGNVRNDISVGIKNYKESNPIPTPKENHEPKSTEDLNSELLRRIDELEKKNAQNERNAMISGRRSDIASRLKEKGCRDKEWINSLLEEVNLDGEDFDAEARAEKYIKMWNKVKASDEEPAPTPKNPTGGDDEDKHLQSNINAILEMRKTRV